jgi:hypothetical protein
MKRCMHMDAPQSRLLRRARWFALAQVTIAFGCATAVEPPHDHTPTAPKSIAVPPQSAAPRASATAAAPAPAASSAAPRATVDVAAYPWLGDSKCAPQTVTVPIATRIAAPAGFERVRNEPGSFGEWLRGLPLRPRGPVVDHKGRVVLEEDDPRLEAVIAIDEGAADLQQCADSIMRLHGEWLWSKGNRAMSYKAASGMAMPFEGWLAGDRVVEQGAGSVAWKRKAAPSDRDDHSVFRRYMDAVFSWSNTGALSRDAAKSSLETLRPGDFFVLPGSPGHAMLVLDVARNSAGERAVLLGQGFMPAQSFHVLRASADSAWFAIDAASGGVQTHFWPAPFPWSSLRRLD